MYDLTVNILLLHRGWLRSLKLLQICQIRSNAGRYYLSRGSSLISFMLMLNLLAMMMAGRGFTPFLYQGVGVSF